MGNARVSLRKLIRKLVGGSNLCNNFQGSVRIVLFLWEQKVKINARGEFLVLPLSQVSPESHACTFIVPPLLYLTNIRDHL